MVQFWWPKPSIGELEVEQTCARLSGRVESSPVIRCELLFVFVFELLAWPLESIGRRVEFASCVLLCCVGGGGGGGGRDLGLRVAFV